MQPYPAIDSPTEIRRYVGGPWDGKILPAPASGVLIVVVAPEIQKGESLESFLERPRRKARYVREPAEVSGEYDVMKFDGWEDGVE